MNDLNKRIKFLLEIDKLKEVVRNSYLISQGRKENSAEHSWHIALLALTLLENTEVKVDILKVLKMILLHDIVEIDAGDLLVYLDSPEILKAKREREQASATRIFGLLPEEQGREFIALWEEFEDEKTPEALYAASLDRVMPLLHNIQSAGKSWQENNITLEQVVNKNSKIAKNCPEIWSYLKPLIEDTFKKFTPSISTNSK